MAEIFNLDPIDVNNTGRFPENMQFRNVNDGGRALEGMLARWFKDTNCSLTASGINNAYAVTANRVLSAYSDSMIVGFTPNHTNTGAATLNVSGLGAKTIVRPNGDTVLAGDIVNGSKVQVIYVQSPVDKFLLLTMPAVAGLTGIPVGAIVAWPASSVPTGWLECYGQAVSRTTYAALFAAIGTAYGVGDGSTTFNLPDMRGRTIAGEDDMGGSSANRLTGVTNGVDGDTLGAAGGLESTTIGQANLPNVNLSGAALVTESVVKTASFTPSIQGGGSGGITFLNSLSVYADTEGAASISGNVPLGGSGTAINNVQPTIIFKWCILATPAAALSTSGIGKNETWIGARNMTARVTSGAGSATRDSGANDITQPVFDFDASSQEYVHLEWVPPKRWNKGTVSFKAYWVADAGTPAETAVFLLAGRSISHDDPVNGAFGTAQSSTVAMTATGKLQVGAESAQITIGSTPLDGDLILFELSRDVATDNLAADARLVGIKLIWNSNATSDD
jgi:microcystin-dependent protein